MYIHDRIGVVSSIVYGPDDRTRIVPATRQAVFCVYAPAGVPPEAVERHLGDIASNARLISPGAAVLQQDVHRAAPGPHPER
jgi:hypothetical protein